jgi:hypothetical protein
VSASWAARSGQGRLVTDDKGILALGALSSGTYDITFAIPDVATTQPPQKLLIGLLLPAVQKVRTISKSLTPGFRGTLKIEVGPEGGEHHQVYPGRRQRRVGQRTSGGVTDRVRRPRHQVGVCSVLEGTMNFGR